jgi:hypothetical protein
LKAKTKLIIALIVTAILAVYGIELGIRTLTGGGNREYLIVVVVILVLLLLVDLRLYGSYKREKIAS